MEKRISFWALIAIWLALGVLFFRIVQPFLAPLFVAAVVAMLAHPFQEWLAGVLGGRRRAAACLAAGILLIGLLLIGMLLLLTGRELVDAGTQLAQTDLQTQPVFSRLSSSLRQWFPGLRWEDIQSTALGAVERTSQAVLERTQQYLANLVAFAIGLAVMGMALYYFLSEGRGMLRKLHQLSPLQTSDEDLLFDRFGRVCRGLVLGTLVCAAGQAVLLGVGMWLAGVERFWALAGLTLLLAMVPVVGSAGVWIPVTLWLLWSGRYAAAVGLGMYGALVVSTSDNLIRAYVLQGAARMHPLLALISALGGVKLVGLWGIFLGPVVAALFTTLIQVVHERLDAEIRESELGKL